MASLRDLLRLARPHFLVGGLAFHLLGLALAERAGADVTLAVAGLGQAFVTLVQLGVHYGNEAHDLAADRANATRTRFAGGSRVLLDGTVPVEDALRAGRAAFALAAAAGLGLLALAWPRLAPAPLAALAGVLLAIALLAHGYSAPPLRLHSTGLGELATGVIVAGLVPLLPFAALGVLASAPGLVLAPPALQVAALVAVLALPDADGDGSVGKRTLAVRVGPRRTRRLLQATWVACGLGTTAAIAWGAPPAFALAGGAAFALSVALPVLVLRQAWDVLALAAAGLVALQWALTMAWAVGWL